MNFKNVAWNRSMATVQVVISEFRRQSATFDSDLEEHWMSQAKFAISMWHVTSQYEQCWLLETFKHHCVTLQIQMGHFKKTRISTQKRLYIKINVPRIFCYT